MTLVPTVRGAALLAAALVLSSSVLPSGARAQSPDPFWSDVAEAAMRVAGAPATATRTLRLDRTAMAQRLAAAPLEALGDRAARPAAAVEVPIPLPDGTTEWFRVVESPVMAAGLQARYPAIRTYAGQGRDTPSATARISLTPSGFAAMAHTPAGIVFVDPAGGDVYHSVFRRDAGPTDVPLGADRVIDPGLEAAGAERAAGVQTTNGRFLRTYRLALSATGEYTRFHSQRAGNASNVADALAAQVVAINRVNEIYERDLSIRMQIVAGNDQLIFTDGATDPFTNNNGETLLRENQTEVTARIGRDNYDIGHVFSTGGGGIALLGVVCSPSFKAQGVTGLPQPVNDPFYIDYVAHEIGHQFSANHTFNGSVSNCAGGNRNAATAYEPGSGTTIMGYAGICAPQNTQTFSDSYFHAASLQEIVGFVTNGGGSTCGTVTETGNDIPVVTVPPAVTVPARTPFRLTGSATDATPGALTYTWEEFDLGPAGPPASGGVPAGPPFFRSFTPDASPTRYFPQLPPLLANQLPVSGEALPQDARALTFRLTVRDNRAGGGAIADGTVFVTVDTGAGPFSVSSFNQPGTTVVGGTTQTVRWDVARTNLKEFDAESPDPDNVDVENVQILYSPTGGFDGSRVAFDTVLLASTPNDGAAEVVIPNVVTGNGRILVAAVGNVFFDVNDAPITVTQGTDAEARPGLDASLSAVRPNPVSGRASVTLSAPVGETVSVVVVDALGREVARLHDGPAASEQVFSVDVSTLPPGVYVVRARGASVQAARRFTVVR